MPELNNHVLVADHKSRQITFLNRPDSYLWIYAAIFGQVKDWTILKPHMYILKISYLYGFDYALNEINNYYDKGEPAVKEPTMKNIGIVFHTGHYFTIDTTKEYADKLAKYGRLSHWPESGEQRYSILVDARYDVDEFKAYIDRLNGPAFVPLFPSFSGRYRNATYTGTYDGEDGGYIVTATHPAFGEVKLYKIYTKDGDIIEQMEKHINGVLSPKHLDFSGCLYGISFSARYDRKHEAYYCTIGHKSGSKTGGIAGSQSTAEKFIIQEIMEHMSDDEIVDLCFTSDVNAKRELKNRLGYRRFFVEQAYSKKG